MKSKSNFYFLFGLFFISIFVRLAFFYFFRGNNFVLTGDEPAYYGYVESLFSGEGWSFEGTYASRPPLTPLFIIPLCFILGLKPISGIFTIIILSSLVPPVLYSLTRKLYPGKLFLAQAMGILWVFYPLAIYYSSFILTETLTSLLVLLSVLFFIIAHEKQSVIWSLLTGVIWGLCALNRSSYLYFPFFLLIAYIILNRFTHIQIRWNKLQWLAGIFALILTISPWVYRNYTIFHLIIPTETRLGYGLFLCNHDLTNEKIQKGNCDRDIEKIEAVKKMGENEIEIDKIMKSMVLDEIKNNWRLLPGIVFNRAKNFWLWGQFILYGVFWIPVLLLFVLSFWKIHIRDDWFVLAIIFYSFLTVLPFWGVPRFRFPVEALIILRAFVTFLTIVPFARKFRVFNRGSI